MIIPRIFFPNTLVLIVESNKKYGVTSTILERMRTFDRVILKHPSTPSLNHTELNGLRYFVISKWSLTLSGGKMGPTWKR